MGVDRTPSEIRNTGVGLTPNSTSVSDSSTQILAANSLRKWVYLTNDGNKDVYISCGVAAQTSKGIVVGANGGILVIDATNHNTEAVYGITKQGTSNVIYQEGQ